MRPCCAKKTDTIMVRQLAIPIFGLLLLFCHQKLTAQHPDRQDYERAVSFLWSNVENKTAFNLYVKPNWFPDSSGLWWIDHQKTAKTYQKLLFHDMQVQPLFDHKRMAASLEKKLGKTFDPKQLPLSMLVFKSATELRFSVDRQIYGFDLATYTFSPWKRPEDGRGVMESRSPDGKWIAFTKDYNLFLRSTEDEREFQLSFDGKKNYEYGSYYGWFDRMEGENGTRPDRFRVNWSPDSRYLQTNVCDLRSANKMYMLDWSKDSLYRPRLLSYYRGSPGDTNMVYQIPVVYDVQNRKKIKTGLPRNTHINSVGFRWSSENGKAFASYMERGFKKANLLQLDLTRERSMSLLTDHSRTNIDNFDYWILEEKDAVLFTSERSGWKQLYCYDLKEGRIRPLTKGQYYVNGIAYVDKQQGQVYFMASGKEKDRNPYHQHLYRISLQGGEVQLLTPEDRHHQVEFSPDGRYFFDNYSTANLPTRSVLRNAQTGKVIKTISEADITALKAMKWKAPQLFEAIARDGKTKIYGAIWKPTNFNPSRKYPIIDHSYTGPHTQMFPKDFRRVLSTSNQALAELGFLVIMVDGLGTAGRSKAFHDYSYKNMGYNLADHVLAFRQLAQQYKWIDLDNVGIFGTFRRRL